MQTPETDSAVISFPANEEVAPAPQGGNGGNYDAVRFNALKHGILSRYTVLSHEDGDEYQALLSALVEEHQPAGATEAHLVEELAIVLWRKRRVLMAEGAVINRGLLAVATKWHEETREPASPARAAAPFELGRQRSNLDRPAERAEAVTLSPEEVAERQRETRRDLEAVQQAAEILRRGGARAYRKAVRALSPSSRAWWEDEVEQEEYPVSAEGLAECIRDHMEPYYRGAEAEARHHHAIKAQTLGEGMQVDRFESLSRYETHLDRKFERTLAMLLKLKELRGGR